MATTERDYYEVLGVPRDADEADIKRAFRRLARELHPDVSEAPDAQERFREVVEAYEVLSKRETRDLYDRYGHAGLRSGGFQPGHFDFGSLSDLFAAFFGDDLIGGRAARSRGADLAAEVEIDLADAAKGVNRGVPFEVAVACSHCEGSGAEPGSAITTCPACGGLGRLQQVSRSVFGEFVRTATCPECAGSGRRIETPCRECEGRTLRLVAHVPRGDHEILPRGERRGDDDGVSSVFARENDDLFSTVDLTMTQAALGAMLRVPTLDGEAELEFAPGTQPGTVVVLRGRGMPALRGFGRGDHRVLVNVLVPSRLNEEQRRLLEEFDMHVDERTYKADEGFFEKLKSAFR